jgi:peptidoglycan/xylan/chitin deacetylase (PgdA/CDA1 family)
VIEDGHGGASTVAWAASYTDVKPALGFSGQMLRDIGRHGFLSVAGRLVRFGSESFVRCLYGHWVFDDQITAFRSLLQRLQRVGSFVSTATLLELVKGERELDGRYFHLSFDDGFDNLYRNAFPVLADLEISATLFVPTQFVGASDAEVVERWWRRDQARVPTRPLQWPWLAEMVRAGCDVGSHTRSHARLSAISRDRTRLTAEIADSKRELEQRLSIPCRYFAWPYGTHHDIDERGLALVEEAGYEASFSAVRERIVPGRTDLFSIPRHHFEPSWPWDHVRFFAAGGHEGG